MMAFKFTMRNGEQIVHCQISNAALGNLAGRWRCGERDVPAEFEAHRKLIETMASARFDQTSTRIFAKHVSTAQRGRKDTDQHTEPETHLVRLRWDHRTTVRLSLFGCDICLR